jgi:hypothetical protein
MLRYVQTVRIKYLQSKPAHYHLQATYSKAAKAELSRNYDLAFRLYIKAAELFLHLSRTNKGHVKAEAQWKASAGKALQRAEKIKAFVEQSKTNPGSNLKTAGERSSLPHTSPGPQLNLTPVGINHFSNRRAPNIIWWRILNARPCGLHRRTISYFEERGVCQRPGLPIVG